jgi:hypothetical protein
MKASNRCALRSGAGGPAFDLYQLGRNMGFGLEKINVNPASDSAPFPYLNTGIPRNRQPCGAKGPDIGARPQY